VVIVACVIAAGGLVLLSATAALGEAEQFAKPVTHQLRPEKACHYEMQHIIQPPGATGPTLRRIEGPGRPGLSATASSPYTARVNWSVASTPRTCRTAALLISIGNYAHWQPITVSVQTHGRTHGTLTLTVPSVASRPDIIWASAFSRQGGRSEAGVLIRR
jgi:hypothetical protein